MLLLRRFVQTQKFWTVPNMLTMSRVAMTPVLFGTLLNQDYKSSMVLIAAAATTDFLDGYIARKYNQSSPFGSFLDPFADKFFVVTVSVALFHTNLMPVAVFVPFVGRDLVLLGTSIYWRYITLPAPKTASRMISLLKIPNPKILPTNVSKINTALQMGYVTTLVVKSFLGSDISLVLFEGLVVGTSLWSMFQYVLYRNF